MTREMQMQEVTIGIYALSQKTGIGISDLMAVFGGILHSQVQEYAKQIGQPGEEAQKILLGAFALGLSGELTKAGTVQ